MKFLYRARRNAGGFSLLEVMIAVVVLATGMLALAALQSSLTRSSAEAKTRARVAALLSAHMDQLRAAQYTAAATLASDGCATDLGASDWVPASFCQEAGIGALTATQSVTTWSSAVGAASFTAGRVPAAGGQEPEFKRVVLAASWNDAAGGGHTLSMTTQLSSLALRDSLLPPPASSGTATGKPIVTEDTPEGAGVIPVVLGNGNSSAASNPTPELVGRNNVLVGTRFNVLTYTPSGSSATIQKRFETDVIKCSCQYGAGGTNLPEIYRTAQWPAIWNGERYELFKPSTATDAPGQAYNSGPKAGVTQSPLCQECCRDHHDNATTGVAKFDPEATGAYQKYDINGSGNLVTVGNTTNSSYVDSCRVIRVDGFWRTAADMYSRQFGLLETETVSGVQAKTGVPTTSATNAYKNFVKDYLKQYDGSVATAPANAQTLYDDTTRGLNNPATVTITPPLSSTDYRYLHARGLYVDYLEQAARDKITKVLASRRAQGQCLVGGTDLADCVLPYLPFTTINLTEIAKWTASDATVLDVNSQNQLGDDVPTPSGGRTVGLKSGTADNVSTMRTSNSGVAVVSTSSLIQGAVDNLGDQTTVTDRQSFTVGTTTASQDTFNIGISGGGGNPFVFYGSALASCSKPSTLYSCVASSGTLPASELIRIDHYNVYYAENDANAATVTNPCRSGKTTSMPYEVVYDVTGASSSNNSAAISALTVTNNGIFSATAGQGEYTEFTVNPVAKDDRISVTIGNARYMCPSNYPGSGGSAQCTGNGANAKPTWSSTWVSCPSQSGPPSM